MQYTGYRTIWCLQNGLRYKGARWKTYKGKVSKERIAQRMVYNVRKHGKGNCTDSGLWGLYA